MRRPPLPILVALALLVPVGPVGLVVGHRAHAASPTGPTLAATARQAGCTLRDFEDGVRTNPPVTGRIVERIWAPDGSYAGRRPPPPLATIHALLHGRVLFQYRRDVRGDELHRLDRLTREDSGSVLLFENQTGMRARVAATAYLSLMTCPRADRPALRALAVFRDRRRGFGQGF